MPTQQLSETGMDGLSGRRLPFVATDSRPFVAADARAASLRSASLTSLHSGFASDHGNLASFERRFAYDDATRELGVEMLSMSPSRKTIRSIARPESPRHPPFFPVVNVAGVPPPGSLMTVPPWTRGGQSSLGAHNCGKPERRRLVSETTPGEKMRREAQARAHANAAVARWREGQRKEGTAWRASPAAWSSRARKETASIAADASA